MTSPRYPIADNLACPLDGLKLVANNQVVACANGHSFDIARNGYINLMPVQQKKTKDPGDSKVMVAARKALLDSGVYQPISTRLNTIVSSMLASRTEFNVLDAGCGEGYYLTGYMDYEHSIASPRVGHYVGMDISKWACQAAAKRSQDITWVVASNRNPPLLAGSVDILFCMFGFHQFSAFKKVLKPAGVIVTLDPAENHLLELRRIIYPSVKISMVGEIRDAALNGFTLRDQHDLTFKISLTADQIKNLLTMTPHLFRATSEGKMAAANLVHLDLTVDVLFRVFSL